jgi:hypothetical protein
MITRPLGKQDYDHIVQVIDRWWGGPTSALAHPLFFYELGSLARVVEHDGILVASEQPSALQSAPNQPSRRAMSTHAPTRYPARLA